MPPGLTDSLQGEVGLGSSLHNQLQDEESNNEEEVIKREI